MNFDKIATHWMSGVPKALVATRCLHREGCHLEALFWGHLAIEKALKSLVVRRTSKHAPMIHNLIRLAELADIEFPEGAPAETHAAE